MASLEGNALHSSINTICNVDTGGDGSLAFACGSSDKSIRIYKTSNEQAALQTSSRTAEINADMVD